MYFLLSELPDPTLIIDPITEERASRTLYRIELLRRIREQVLPHPLLSEHLKLCQPSPDLPEWWECGRHDRDLLLGASKHGVSRTDYHILNDPTLGFLEAHQRYISQRGAGVGIGTLGEPTKFMMGTAESSSVPLLSPAELASAAAATRCAVDKVEEEGGQELKTEDNKDERLEVKMEIEEGDGIIIPCTKTESTNEEMEHQGVVEEGQDLTINSPMKEVKTEQIPPKTEKDDEDTKTEEQTEEDKKFTNEFHQNKDLTEEKSRSSPEHPLSSQKNLDPEPPEQPDPSSKAQLDHKAAEEEDGEEKEAPEALKSPNSAEKSPEEEEEERLDEDDKSEKSSQAEGAMSRF